MNEVRVRELTAADGAVLDAVFAGLSLQSRYLRFHGAVPRLSAAARRQLTALDGRHHVAFGAFADRNHEPVGLVRIIATGDGRAEVAVEVVDAWQGRGVGTCLVRRAKERAAELGYRRLVAEVLAENRAVQALLRGVFPGATASRYGVDITMSLPIGDDIEFEMSDLLADLVA
jgi:RimJ/RimL family protein N-acetyltransferase